MSNPSSSSADPARDADEGSHPAGRISSLDRSEVEHGSTRTDAAPDQDRSRHPPAHHEKRHHHGPITGLRRCREAIRQRPPVDHAYRIAVAVVGFLILGVGVVLLPLPGPGWLIIFLGLGLLSTEYEWSRRLLAYTKARVGRWSNWVGEQSIVVRAVVGVGCLALVGAVLAVVLWWFGVPTWIPAWVPLIDAIPTRA